MLLLHKDDLGPSIALLSIEGLYEEEETDDPPPSPPNPQSNKSRAGTVPPPPVPRRAKDGVLYRGMRLWKRPSGEIGATGNDVTVCCSQCCSVLGFTNDALDIRLYKHRLSSSSSSTGGIASTTRSTSTSISAQTKKGGAFVRNDCGSFLAKEMIRYAESQAVYLL